MDLGVSGTPKSDLALPLLTFITKVISAYAQNPPPLSLEQWWKPPPTLMAQPLSIANLPAWWEKKFSLCAVRDRAQFKWMHFFLAGIVHSCSLSTFFQPCIHRHRNFLWRLWTSFNQNSRVLDCFFPSLLLVPNNNIFEHTALSTETDSTL